MEPTRLAYLLPEAAELSPDGKLVLRWPGNADPFSAERTIDENAAQGTVQILPDLFNAADCARIRALGEAGTEVEARTARGPRHYRDSRIVWIEPSTGAHWLYHRIGLALLNANAAYRFALTGLVEPLQYTRYTPGGHFGWHTDLGAGGTSGRKLSLTVQVSEPGDYDGGELEFSHLPGRSVGREIGTTIIFPSYLAHRVAPVTRGTRCSLVAWAYGPSLR